MESNQTPHNQMPIEQAYQVLRKLTREQAVNQDLHDVFRTSLESLYGKAKQADKLKAENETLKEKVK